MAEFSGWMDDDVISGEPTLLRKILIVDDEDDIAEAIRMILEAENYEVAVAKDGVEGLKALNDFRPDGIVLDIMMPRMNGIELLERIRKSDEFSELPVLV